jgi:hemolysin III
MLALTSDLPSIHVFDLRDPVSAWTHALWFLLAIPATIHLHVLCRGDRPKQASMLIYGLALMLCYAGSTAFHAVRGTSDHLDFFNRLDHIGIYLLIAGTSTPVIFTVLERTWKWGMLTLAWGLAAAGIALRMSTIKLPDWAHPALYLTMGWGLASCYFQLAQRLTHWGLLQAWAGGFFYSVGALIYAFRWPTPWPGRFSSHDLFHLFVMAGSLCHYWFIRDIIVPYPRRRRVSSTRANTGPAEPVNMHRH